MGLEVYLEAKATNTKLTMSRYIDLRFN